MNCLNTTDSKIEKRKQKKTHTHKKFIMELLQIRGGPFGRFKSHVNHKKTGFCINPDNY